MSDKEIHYPEVGVDENGNAYFHMFDENSEIILTIDKDGMKDKNGKLMQKNNDTNNGWISVEDELPTDQQRVLCNVYRYYNLVLCYNAEDNTWSDLEGCQYDVNYWMPLPKPPKET